MNLCLWPWHFLKGDMLLLVLGDRVCDAVWTQEICAHTEIKQRFKVPYPTRLLEKTWLRILILILSSSLSEESSNSCLLSCWPLWMQSDAICLWYISDSSLCRVENEWMRSGDDSLWWKRRAELPLMLNSSSSSFHHMKSLTWNYWICQAWGGGGREV